MLNDTWTLYILLRAIILVLQWLGPACLGYTVWTISQAWPEVPTITGFRIWCTAEAAFFVFFLWFRVYLQREAIHPPLRSKKERKALFAQVRREVHDPDKFMSGWFRGAKPENIGRDDLKDFLNWAFWDGRADMSPGGADEKELEYYMSRVETMMRRPFKPGRGSQPLCLTMDPIEMECRTLFWYSLLSLLDFICHCLLRTHGFQYFKTMSSSLQVWPPRPATWMEPARSPAQNISYWVRPHTSTKRLPILYIHGIGVGLIPNVGFLHELDTALNGDNPDDGEVGVLAIEILQVSSRITTPMLRREEFLRQLTEILDYNGYDRFVMASHSYGSVLATHIFRHKPLASRVSSALFIDPVTVLLHMPDVAYNFTVRPPRHTNEWQLWYFGSKDPGVATTLGRHFFWHENLLWRDRIMELVDSGTRITASLASKDLIVDTESVGTYLSEDQLPDPVLKEDGDRKQMELEMPNGTSTHWKQRPWRGAGLDVLWWEGLDHAQVFDKESTRSKLVEVLVEYSKGA
ncbi:uncharacterized protein LTR77_005170 [Saxophila tyrrhenica]|uniref:AB hydrolase-1 domain-containing protein n=1 Tax=Saxophila tyrrhenica TaxID=1690608 RepID=A0AAV9PEB2_9PEZI|nr:hypothetical protein LTR77_005170 [Saxophila tyrrhenica]